jgi:hypothetical protein
MSDNSVVAFLQRAAERTGFKRDSFVERNVPASSANIVAIPFFGDLRSTFIFSSLILRRIMELEPNKYFILCSWPGYQDLFPYVDEYWSVKDKLMLNDLALSADDLYNAADAYTAYTRGLLNHFENVLTYDDLKVYYDNGLTTKFWDTFKEVKRFLPEVSSASRLDEGFLQEVKRRSGQQVVVVPVKQMRTWRLGRQRRFEVQKSFWNGLLERMIAEGMTPVVWQNVFTYDMSSDFAERCIYLVPKTVAQAMSAMRTVGCVLDVFSGVSRLALAARCPFVALDERERFVRQKDYEIDDLCSEKTPRQYVFSFAQLSLEGGSHSVVFDNTMARLKSLLPTLDRSEWDSTNESYETVSYDVVRRRRLKRMGLRFLRKY